VGWAGVGCISYCHASVLLALPALPLLVEEEKLNLLLPLLLPLPLLLSFPFLLPLGLISSPRIHPEVCAAACTTCSTLWIACMRAASAACFFCILCCRRRSDSAIATILASAA
jgi:hypothetical protein